MQNAWLNICASMWSRLRDSPTAQSGGTPRQRVSGNMELDDPLMRRLGLGSIRKRNVRYLRLEWKLSNQGDWHHGRMQRSRAS